MRSGAWGPGRPLDGVQGTAGGGDTRARVDLTHRDVKVVPVIGVSQFGVGSLSVRSRLRSLRSSSWDRGGARRRCAGAVSARGYRSGEDTIQLLTDMSHRDLDKGQGHLGTKDCPRVLCVSP